MMVRMPVWMIVAFMCVRHFVHLHRSIVNREPTLGEYCTAPPGPSLGFFLPSGGEAGGSRGRGGPPGPAGQIGFVLHERPSAEFEV